MNEERSVILNMLKDGDISVEEAERLLEAVSTSSNAVAAEAASSNGKIKPKRLVVMVTSEGVDKVNVKIPFSLVRFGLKMGAKYGGIYNGGPGSEEVNNALENLDIDELFRDIDSGEIVLPYKMVDVYDMEDGKNDHVEVIIE